MQRFFRTGTMLQENMKEIEKLFETEFDYMEEFRSMALL